jgi:UDP-N-acetyl-D-mannosaminuronate dehydrogenase
VDGKVDSSHICSAIAMLQNYVNNESIVVIESTVAVGMTRKFLGPLAASRGILAGMSPEVSSPHRGEDRRLTDNRTED